jgi:hypothetical protein
MNQYAPKRSVEPWLALIIGLVVLAIGWVLLVSRGTPMFWILLPEVVLVGYALIGTPLLLAYQVTPEAIRIRGPLGWFTLRKEQVTTVQVVEYKIHSRSMGIATVGAVYGWFEVKPWGNIRVYAGSRSGAGVLIKLSDQSQILLNPSDPTSFQNNLPTLGYTGSR